ncbi:hypothetical protein TGRUB_364460 [Toxoplasma gondii RUB]|uniref:Uncharacterized protein n=2 Tax=Toxoplasma gondii TaxID=5811 RepID=A0A086LVG6_TOXGO|nr:hypothetical protein TGRUB_364460 [Toxoplasma gondii RUB]KFH15592.1 hypothetical protein TGMAS_364460 [Toxoplasma gondii MAS]
MPFLEIRSLGDRSTFVKRAKLGQETVSSVCALLWRKMACRVRLFLLSRGEEIFQQEGVLVLEATGRSRNRDTHGRQTSFLTEGEADANQWREEAEGKKFLKKREIYRQKTILRRGRSPESQGQKKEK